MKKIVFLSLLALSLTSFASSNPFMHFEKKLHLYSNKQGMVNHNAKITDYTDFSGEWVGNCDDEPDEETIVIDNTASELVMDGSKYSIDGITTIDFKDNYETGGSTVHLNWNSSGTQLKAAVIGYQTEGSLADDYF